jgi:hypothetical protein
MSLQVEHNGFVLRYSDNEDKWSVWELKLEDKSLAKLKQKVNKFVSNKLKTANLVVGIDDSSYSYGPPEKRQVVSRDAATGEYWVIQLKTGRRERVKAEKLFPWTPSIDATLVEYERLRSEGHAILRQASDLLKTLKKGSKDEIADMLIELSKAPEEE